MEVAPIKHQGRMRNGLLRTEGRVQSQSCCSLLWEVHYKSLVSYPAGLLISPALLGNKKRAGERRRKEGQERDEGG